jgi:hypothetical protein
LYRFTHKWAHLLTQQTSSITVYRLPIKENTLPFSVFRLQQTNGVAVFRLVPFSADIN